MEHDEFRFKHFSALHGRSSMKIGVDAVLLGAWAGKADAATILDAGTGCGVIALMLKQIHPEAEVLAIDVDEDSVEEAAGNFERSGFSPGLRAKKMSFPTDLKEFGLRFDMIVSNPPYFKSGIENPSTSRERARHQASLSVFSLLESCRSMLNPGGVLAVIIPAVYRDEALEFGRSHGMVPSRECLVRNNPRRPFKRVMMEFMRKEEIPDSSPEMQSLTLFEDGEPTSGYKQLCKDFYLKF